VAGSTTAAVSSTHNLQDLLNSARWHRETLSPVALGSQISIDGGFAAGAWIDCFAVLAVRLHQGQARWPQRLIRHVER
jgi:hypothetical protein